MNCLVKKLKAVVDNDNLEKFGRFTIEIVNPGSASDYALLNGTGIKTTYKDTSDNIIWEDRTGAVTAGQLTSAGTLEVINKWELTFIDCYYVNGVKFNTDVLKTCTKLVYILLTNSNVSFNLSDFKDLTALTTLKLITRGTKKGSINDLAALVNLKTIEFGSNFWNINGNISVFANMPNLTNLDIQQSKVNGDIADLASNIFLTTLNIQQTNHISGTLESFANGQAANRESGQVKIIFNGIVTYEGVAVPNVSTKTVKFGTSMVNPTAEETERGWQVV